MSVRLTDNAKKLKEDDRLHREKLAEDWRQLKEKLQDDNRERRRREAIDALVSALDTAMIAYDMVGDRHAAFLGIDDEYVTVWSGEQENAAISSLLATDARLGLLGLDESKALAAFIRDLRRLRSYIDADSMENAD